MAQDQVQGLLFNRLFGQKTDGPAGLLGNPMLQVGMGLLASRADPRINPFGAAMTGLTNAAQFRQIEEDRKREMEERERMDKVREQLSKIIPGMFSTRVEGPPTPDGVAPTQISPMGQALGEVAQLDPLGAFDVLTQMQGQGANDTAAIRDYMFYQSLPPEQRAEWDRMNARQQNAPVILQEMAWLKDPARTPQEIEQYWSAKRSGNVYDVGGVPTYRPPGPNTQTQPLTTLGDVAYNESFRAAQTAAAEARARLQTDAEARLGPARITAEETKAFIGQLRNHPGKSTAVGTYAWANPFSYISSDAKDFRAMLETAQGKQFAVAYETLRGGGTITEVETEQATKALGNLMTAQSEEQFNRALDSFESALDTGIRKIEAQAGGNVKVDGILGLGGGQNASDWMDDMPDPASMSGKVIEDDQGNRYRSDGKQWVKQ